MYPRRADLNMMLEIGDMPSLRAWDRQLRTIVRSGELPEVRFQVPVLTGDQNRSMSALANGYRKACGCGTAGMFMSLAVVGIVATFFISGGHLSDLGLMHIAVLVAATVLASLSGKFVGLLAARWRLLKLALGLRHMMAGADQTTDI